MHLACNANTVVQAELRRPSPRQAIAWGVLPFACLILTGTAEARAETSCSAPTTSFVVTAEYYLPTVTSSLTGEELRNLAAHSPRKSLHPPLGFYVATFGYGVEVFPHDAQQCAMAVTVRLFLAPRLIEIGTDGPCRPEIVAEHYLLHARQDDLLLSRYAEQAREMLDHLKPVGWWRGGEMTERDVVVRSVTTALDRLLQPYDEERQQALAAADTAEALARLNQGCGRAT